MPNRSWTASTPVQTGQCACRMMLAATELPSRLSNAFDRALESELGRRSLCGHTQRFGWPDLRVRICAGMALPGLVHLRHAGPGVARESVRRLHGTIARTSADVRNDVKQCDLRIQSLGQIDRIPRRSNRSLSEVPRKQDSAYSERNIYVNASLRALLKSGVLCSERRRLSLGVSQKHVPSNSGANVYPNGTALEGALDWYAREHPAFGPRCGAEGCVGIASSFRDSCTPIAPPSSSQRAISYSLLFGMIHHSMICNPAAASGGAFGIPTRPLNATVFSHAAAHPRSNKLLCERRHRWSISGGRHVAALTRFQPLSRFGSQNHLCLAELLPN